MRTGSLVVAGALWIGGLAIARAAAADDPDEGVLTTPDGHETRVSNDDLHYTGVGRLVWSNGKSYSGEFVDGHPQGRGIEQLPDGSSYDGDWTQGRQGGTGTAISADGSRYDGQFQDGVRSGQGLFQSAAGVYEGAWADDAPQGEGHFDYADGAAYDGAWAGGRRNGPGIYRRPDGATYDGDWGNDMPDGYGHMSESEDSTYDGGWSRGQRSGYGAMQIGERFGYEGIWVANVRQGYGREVRPDGSTYTGEWRDDQRDGQGILKMQNGAFHDGSWQHNSTVGEGTRVSAEGIRITGAWDGDYVANGVVELRGGATYRGDLYDPKSKSVDPLFLAWLERIANQGDPGAALLLGEAYRYYARPPADRDKANLWYGRAATGGLAEAQYQLAELTIEQSGSTQRALQLLMDAAAQGHAAANTRLGVFYQLGTYVEKSPAQAQRYYEVAIVQGDLIARNNLAWLLATSPDADLRDGKRAVSLAQPLAVLYTSPGHLDTLAAAQAESGDFAAAARTERRALAEAGAGAEALRDLQRRLTLFQRNEPYREP